MSYTVPLTHLEHFYVPFARVDDEARTVSGYAFTQARVRGDKWNLKRETLERASRAYMEMPCVRAMHAPVAAGKALQVRFDDKGAFIEAYIGDDNEWRKCRDGIYRGFSIGGKPLLVRGDDIEEFDWIETSLVDRPKDPGALFTVVRADGVSETDALGEVVVLPAEASDEEVARVEAELGLLRYDHNQPRDENGMWTIVAGHRVSVHGRAVDHSDILKAKARFELSDEATGALLQAHKDGKIQTDQHLFRTLSHAGAKSSNQGGMLPDVTSAHIASGVAHHGMGGAHENQWHSEAHGMAPKLQPGMRVGKTLGAEQLQKGDVVHFPAHEGKPAIAGVVHKVNKTSVHLGSVVGDASLGMRVKKSDLKRPGFVKRDFGVDGHGKTHAMLHHIEVNRGEALGDDVPDESVLRYHTEALFAVLTRSEPGEARAAVEQVAEHLQTLIGERENMEQSENLKNAPKPNIKRGQLSPALRADLEALERGSFAGDLSLLATQLTKEIAALKNDVTRAITSDTAPEHENLEGAPSKADADNKRTDVMMLIEDALETKDLPDAVVSALKAAHEALAGEPLARAEMPLNNAYAWFRDEAQAHKDIFSDFAEEVALCSTIGCLIHLHAHLKCSLRP